MGNNIEENINPSEIKLESRLKIILRTSIIAILTNIAIGIFKAIVGIITNSIAITMDAINNFTDAGSSFITILSSYFATKDPDKKHPFGYGRTEYLGTLLIAILILYAGITSFIESINGIIEPQAAEYSSVSIIIIIVAVIAKIVLAIYITKSGKKVQSDSLIASGKESIGDVAISISTIVAALIFIYSHISIEAWVGAIIAVLILKTGLEILKETIDKILGTGGDPKLVVNIKRAICKHEGVLGAYDLVLHNYGPDSYLASVHIEVLDTLSISEFDDLSRKIQEDIFSNYGVHLAAIGVYSSNTMDEDVIKIREDVKSIALGMQYVNQLHGFYLEKNKSMRFDLVISFEAKDRRSVYEKTVAKIKEKYPEYDVNAGMDSDYNEI